MYEVEDISEDIGDGFIWYSVIHNMNIYRVQCMRSGTSDNIEILHTYNIDGAEMDDEEEVERAVTEFTENQNEAE